MHIGVANARSGIFAYHRAKIDGAGLVFHAGTLGQRLDETTEARVALLEGFGEVDKQLNRRDEYADVERIHNHVGRL